MTPFFLYGVFGLIDVLIDFCVNSFVNNKLIFFVNNLVVVIDVLEKFASPCRGGM